MRKPSPAMIVALAALFVALGGVGVAATGGNFILGQSNTADATSVLSGAVANGPQLQVANSDLGAGIRARSNQGAGVLGEHVGTSGLAPGVDARTSSTDPSAVALSASNPGGGPALSLNVKPGVPPLTVDSAQRVPNLDADLLDGLDASAFVQGGGHVYFTHADSVPQGPAENELLNIPGAGRLVDTCGGQSFAIGFRSDYNWNMVYQENSQLNGQDAIYTNAGRGSSLYWDTSGFQPVYWGNSLLVDALVSNSSRSILYPSGVLEFHVGGWFNKSAGTCVFQAIVEGAYRPAIKL